ncbi:MAG TPA: AAA family ATPase, partial [Solirubrobacteraceae bacterium]|nr:AAA family ATPase [Solirubrobacteraceae bacterium]
FSGRAGVGKTSLLREGKRAAREAGFSVGSAVGSPMESGLPFGLLGQAVVQLVGSTVDDSSELQPLGDPAAGLYRMFRCLTSAAAEAPLLLALDDLHWADPDSLTFLGFLARRITSPEVPVRDKRYVDLMINARIPQKRPTTPESRAG